MKPSSLIFLILVLGYLGKNHLVLVSSGVLLLFKFLGILPQSASAQNTLLDLGVILLVVGVLLPLCTGEFNTKDVYRNIFTLEGAIIFLVGIASAVMARDGVQLLKENPSTMICLLMGSIVGTAFFKGLPTGPLVAAGLAAFFLNLAKRL
ncbi:MAG: DUF441 domain-containing protein [Thermosediminibacteraceae bacterium]|nr:DUF441 domain-containing protein [Thermosediminibacteraceae bacterium]